MKCRPPGPNCWPCRSGYQARPTSAETRRLHGTGRKDEERASRPFRRPEPWATEMWEMPPARPGVKARDGSPGYQRKPTGRLGAAQERDIGGSLVAQRAAARALATVVAGGPVVVGRREGSARVHLPVLTDARPGLPLHLCAGRQGVRRQRQGRAARDGPGHPCPRRPAPPRPGCNGVRGRRSPAASRFPRRWRRRGESCGVQAVCPRPRNAGCCPPRPSHGNSPPKRRTRRPGAAGARENRQRTKRQVVVLGGKGAQVAKGKRPLAAGLAGKGRRSQPGSVSG